MDPLPLPPPSEPWLPRLRRGHRIWCPKEAVYATIAWAWEPPEPGCIAGRIAIQLWRNRHVGPVAVWFVDEFGRGLDRSQIICPVEGNLPVEDAPISEPIVRQMMRMISGMQHRIEQLEAEIRTLQSRSPFMDW